MNFSPLSDSMDVRQLPCVIMLGEETHTRGLQRKETQQLFKKGQVTISVEGWQQSKRPTTYSNQQSSQPTNKQKT